MTQALGAVVVVLLVAAMLAREAGAVGALALGPAARRALAAAIFALAAGFLTVITIHLVTIT